jgi:hypothetical protein
VSSTQRRSRWRGWAIAGLALIAGGLLGAPAAADSGHLPGFGVAAKRVAIAKLPETPRFTFAGFPDGVEAVEIDKPGGAIGRTVPVIDNTIAFTIGREDIVLHALGGPAVEELERTLPLAEAGKLGGDNRAGCSFYSFFESGKPGSGSRAP